MVGVLQVKVGLVKLSRAKVARVKVALAKLPQVEVALVKVGLGRLAVLRVRGPALLPMARPTERSMLSRALPTACRTGLPASR